jgi:copper chaperone
MIWDCYMTIHLTVPSMACAACADTITKAVQSVDATAQVIADSKTKKVDVETAQAEDAIRAAIAASGYPVQ